MGEATSAATLMADGPTYLLGELPLLAGDASLPHNETRMALRRRGASQNKPFCDGSHRKVGFQRPGTVNASEKPPGVVTGGRLTIRPRPDGPLVCTEPLVVTGEWTGARSTLSRRFCAVRRLGKQALLRWYAHEDRVHGVSPPASPRWRPTGLARRQAETTVSPSLT